MNLQAIRQFYDYNYWAHQRVWHCIEGLSAKQFLQPLDYSVGSIRNQLVHSMSYEWVYLRRMQGHMREPMLAYDDFIARETVAQRWTLIEQAMRAFLDNLTEEKLAETITYYSVGGDEHQNTRLQLLQHLANHSTDHRAQTLAMLHLLGVKTQAQDFIYYLRDPAVNVS